MQNNITSRDILITKIMQLNIPTVSLQNAIDIVDTLMKEDIIIPPCKVGTKVYLVHELPIKKQSFIEPVKWVNSYIDWFGTYVFLTPGRAEERLKEIKESN